MRTMHDAVTAANIPADAKMVAGYVDQIVLAPWSQADWDRFPNAIKVAIVKKATSNWGHVLDVEPGDAKPAEAPGWVRMRRATGFADPTVYCNLSTWPAVRAEFARQGVAQPHYWIARYDGVASIPADWQALGCVAKQYGGDVPGGYDLSAVLDHWPGVDMPIPAPQPGSTSSGVEIMEPILVKASPDTTSVRIRVLTGSATTGLVIRPGAQPVFLGNVYAWGSDKVGVGGNPKSIAGYNPKIVSDRAVPLAGALWCDVEYSSNADFYIQPVA